MTAAAAAVTSRFAAVVVEELVRHGVDTFVIAPGSRSTPLVAAVDAHPRARAVVLTDERVAAFFALGRGRADARGAPTALITTSGTAAAHAYPAVLEAEADGVPLLVLSADRPPELRDSGANQTLDQVRLFGHHVRWQADLPAPSADTPLAALAGLVGHAARRTRDPAGPVHLNLMFRKPLEPAPFAPPCDQDALWRHPERPRTRWSRPTRGLADADAAELTALVGRAERGLIVVGGLACPEEREAARRLVTGLGWPTFADVASGLRLGGPPEVLGAFDALLGADPASAALAADVVLQIGGRVVSDRLMRWLAETRPAEHVRILSDPRRDDPAGTVTWRLEADVATVADALGEDAAEGRPRARLARLRAWSEAAEAAVDRVLTSRAGASASEPALARALTRALPEGSALFVGNSLAVRHVDRWGARARGALDVAANRGVSGIDGLVATAAGTCDALGRPTVALVGDQSFAHDLGGLAAAVATGAPLTVVVVDNGGGQIFATLPIAAHEDLLARCFIAPAGVDVAAACAAFGVAWSRVDGATSLSAALAQVHDGPRVIEVRVDPAASREVEDALANAVSRCG